MALQYGVTLRNNQATQIQASIGASGTLKIFSGTIPGHPSDPDTGTVLCTITLPASFLTSSNGTTALAGTWAGTASGSGNAAFFRMYDGAMTCHLQGNTTTDLILNNNSIQSTQPVSVLTFAVTVGNQ